MLVYTCFETVKTKKQSKNKIFCLVFILGGTQVENYLEKFFIDSRIETLKIVWVCLEQLLQFCIRL
jgi:hypothetical protein